MTIYCDNEAVAQVVATSKTRDLLLGACIRNLWLIIADHFNLDLEIPFQVWPHHSNYLFEAAWDSATSSHRPATAAASH